MRVVQDGPGRPFPDRPAAFRGEPGEQSPDAVGGWSADDAQGYFDFQLQSAIEQHAAVYGWAETERVILDALPEIAGVAS